MDKKSVKVIINRLLIVLFLALVIIQLFHPAGNNDKTVSALHIERMYPVPDSVREVLKKACYDCHSNYTEYPWYNRVQPVAWWLNDHIKEAKHHVNFSEFGSAPLAKQARKLHKCADEVEEGGMPMNYYQWMHKAAVLSPAEKKLLTSWADHLSDSLKGTAAVR